MSLFSEIETITGIIASGQSLSSPIPLGNKSLCGIILRDANLDALSMTFQGSVDGITFVKAVDSSNSEITFTSSGTALNSLVLNAAGTVYAPTDTITLSNGVTHPVITVNTVKLVTATIHLAGGGTGYGSATTFNVTVVGGVGTAAVVNVTSSAIGVVTIINSITTVGSYTTLPATLSGNMVTGGTGTGLSLDLTFGINTFSLTTPGTFTTEVTTFTQVSSSGSGTGATFKTPIYGALPMFMLVDPSTLLGFNWLKLRAGTSGSPQVQSTSAQFDMIIRGVLRK